MKGKRFIGMAIALVPFLYASSSYSQKHDGEVYWHIDPSVKSCSMVIDPSLTQAQWHKFTRQAGATISFKSLAPAEPLGKLNFAFGIDYSITPIDQHDPAWINTFTHPDADCPLGDQVQFPALRASLGVSDRMDVSGYWTTAPGANYGFLGGELKYALRRESAKSPALAVSTSFTMLTGVPDFNFNVYSAGIVGSKRIGMFTPYLGVKESLAVATETTAKVDLNQESLALTQGFLGTSISIWKLGLVAEYNVADVNTFALVIGFRPRVNLP